MNKNIMKTKLLSVFLLCLMVIPMFNYIIAFSYDDTLAKLKNMKKEISDMKEEYNEVIETYPLVLNSLTNENKNAAVNYIDNLMSNDLKEQVKALKNELRQSQVTGADVVLAQIEKVEENSNKIFDENDEITKDLKKNYLSLTKDNVKEMADVSCDILKLLGVDKDENTYTNMMEVLNNVLDKSDVLNSRVEFFLQNNVEDINEVMSLEVLDELLDAVSSMDINKVLDVLDKTLEKSPNEENLRENISSFKQVLLDIKDDVLSLNTLDVQDVLLFTDLEKQNVNAKFVQIEEAYEEFFKIIIRENIDSYLDVLFNSFEKEKTSDVLAYENKVLDKLEEFNENSETKLKDGIKSIVNRLNLDEDLVKKLGFLVILDYIDITPYTSEYYKESFKEEINLVRDTFITKLEGYIEFLDEQMKKEVQDEINKNKADTAQTNIIKINKERFNIVDSIKLLKKRVSEDFLSDNSSMNKKLDLVAPYVYDMYYTNILDTVEKIMSLEKEKKGKTYEYNSLHYYLITDSFIKISGFEDKIGVSNKYTSYAKLVNSKLKTGSTMKITLSNNVYEQYTFVVLGDVYADGRINSQDYMMIKNDIMGTKKLSGINKMAADTYRNGGINSQDYMMIKNYIMDGTKIKL